MDDTVRRFEAMSTRCRRHDRWNRVVHLEPCVPKGIKERDSDIHACEDVGRKEEASVATQVTVSLGAEYALPNITFRPDQP